MIKELSQILKVESLAFGKLTIINNGNITFVKKQQHFPTYQTNNIDISATS